jgi:hypothetical protein
MTKRMSWPAAAGLGLGIAAGSSACQRRAASTPTTLTTTSFQKDHVMTETKQIQFFQDDKLIEAKNAADVPDNIRYVTVDGKPIEVVKVVAHTMGDTRAIEQYAADGTLLLRTLQRKFSIPKPSVPDAG